MESDSFTFRILDQEKTPIRRRILSGVSSMYDPLDFVAPVIIPVKRLCNRKNG